MGQHASTDSDRRRFRVRPGPALWGAGVIAAVLLVLGANGTLASWTQAIISNTSNSVATGNAVILQESNTVGGTTTTCTSAASSTNVSICSNINKYGGTTTPLTPGGSQTTNVTFTNTGSQNASSFVMTPGATGTTVGGQTIAACVSTGPAGATNLCTSSDLSFTVNCSPGSTYTAGSKWTAAGDINYGPAVAPTSALTHTATGTELNAGASWTCQFVVALSATASPLDQGVTVTQGIAWTLNK